MAAVAAASLAGCIAPVPRQHEPAAPQTPSPLRAPDATVAGASQAEWSTRWWQWAWSFDDDASPVRDGSGSLCASGQSGPVFFLAGTYGTARTVRRCSVPAGRTLFFPLVNVAAWPGRGSLEGCESLRRRAAAAVEAPQALVLAIDGVRHEGLAAHRQASPSCFDPEPGARTRSFPPLAAGDGYYVAVGPLSPGTHTVEFGGSLPRSSTQAVSYTLVVE